MAGIFSLRGSLGKGVMFTSRVDKKPRAVLKLVISFVLLAIASAVVWAFIIEPNRIVVNSSKLELKGWPQEFPPLRIVAVSDIHAGAPFVGKEKLDALAAMINQTRPDLVLFPGDFIIERTKGGRYIEPEVIADSLKVVKAPLGVFAVLGNHDWWGDGKRVKSALTSAGIRVIENESVRVEVQGRSFWLMGLADLWTRKPDVTKAMASITDNSPVIAITHNPDLFPSVPERVVLTVAGHTHGGQVCLPLIGRPKVPSRYGQRYAAGLVEENGHYIFVTTGVGTSILPLRFGVPPEVAVLELGAK